VGVHTLGSDFIDVGVLLMYIMASTGYIPYSLILCKPLCVA